MGAAKKLSNLQLELLKVFSVELSDEQLREIKGILSRYFAEKVTLGMDQLFMENDWDQDKIEEWAKEHMRTKYRDK